MFKDIKIPDNNKSFTYFNVEGSSDVFFIQDCAKKNDIVIVIATDNHHLNNIHSQLNSIYNGNLFILPDWGTLAYDIYNSDNEFTSNRIKSLYNLYSKTSGIYIISLNALMQKICPISFISKFFNLSIHNEHKKSNILKQIINAGYSCVEVVNEHGEYCENGNNIDFYPNGSKVPYRLYFIDDYLNKIKIFNIEDQLTTNTVDNIEIMVAKEFPTDKKDIESFLDKFRNYFSHLDIRANNSSVYNLVNNGILVQGIQYYLPLFFDKLDTIFDYIDQQAIVIHYDSIVENVDHQLTEIKLRYKERKDYDIRPAIKPNDLFMASNEIIQSLKNHRTIHLTNKELKSSINRFKLEVRSLGDIKLANRRKIGAIKLITLIDNNPQAKFIFCALTKGRMDNLLQILQEIELGKIYNLDNINQYTSLQHKFNITVNHIDNGFILTQDNIIIISEQDLLGSLHKNTRKKKEVDINNIVNNLSELVEGQILVHQLYGLCRFIGLKTIKIADEAQEFLELKFKDTNLLLPIYNMYMVSRYSANEFKDTILNSINKKDKWIASKLKAFEKIRDVASELLEIQANRSLEKGFAFKLDNEIYNEFISHFPYQTTTDQQNSIDAILADMQSSNKMDRLLCGDVGYGKTEVAMRAALLAISNNKQVAILVPTTLLAQQHYDSFKDRFAHLACRIELLSRFRTTKEQNKTLDGLDKGSVDIVIGTHKLLGKQVKFRDLGLLIIDEEHQFGVSHKEKIKKLKCSIDVLSMTATPIPRTLNMSMNGIRDISIIQSAPENRLAIKTSLIDKNDYIIAQAINREILRGGQVFYLYNRVNSIQYEAEEIQKLVPHARIAVAHGQLKENDLENIMMNFHNQRYNVLICSTIIETGIDIPNANTIIIDQADKFGLAQLHQLRGRVGRSNRQAYAYFIVNSKERLTKEARLRLDAITSISSLGAGFLLATQDLEIRGAGSILGEEQSGQIDKIGYNNYMNMLKKTINQIKAGKIPSLESVNENKAEINLNISAVIPDKYIINPNIRLSIYKRISITDSIDELDEIQIELIDRYGKYPEPVANLIAIARLQLKIQDTGITKIDLNGQICRFFINQNNNKINMNALFEMIQINSVSYKLKENYLEAIINNNSSHDTIEHINKILNIIVGE